MLHIKLQETTQTHDEIKAFIGGYKVNADLLLTVARTKKGHGACFCPVNRYQFRFRLNHFSVTAFDFDALSLSLRRREPLFELQRHQSHARDTHAADKSVTQDKRSTLDTEMTKFSRCRPSLCREF
jgi:hypothetical protein